MEIRIPIGPQTGLKELADKKIAPSMENELRLNQQRILNLEVNENISLYK